MFKIKKITGRYNKKTGGSFITHSVLNMGREFQTEEEYQKVQDLLKPIAEEVLS